MTGNPSNGPIIIDGGPSIMSIGSAAAPLDFDSLTFHLTINADVEMSLFDQDADGSDNGWFIATDNSPAQQELFKGVSSIIWGASSQVILDLQAGSTADAFNIAGTVSDSSITINGGAGNDTLLGSNYTGTNNIPDRNVGNLAAIFAAGSFFNSTAAMEPISSSSMTTPPPATASRIILSARPGSPRAPPPASTPAPCSSMIPPPKTSTSWATATTTTSPSPKARRKPRH